MSPQNGSCQKLRKCVYVLLKLLRENYWRLFSGQCTCHAMAGFPTAVNSIPLLTCMDLYQKGTKAFVQDCSLAKCALIDGVEFYMTAIK